MSEVPESILSEADRQLTEQGRHRLNPKWPLIKLADKDVPTTTIGPFVVVISKPNTCC